MWLLHYRLCVHGAQDAVDSMLAVLVCTTVVVEVATASQHPQLNSIILCGNVRNTYLTCLTCRMAPPGADELEMLKNSQRILKVRTACLLADLLACLLWLLIDKL